MITRALFTIDLVIRTRSNYIFVIRWVTWWLKAYLFSSRGIRWNLSKISREFNVSISPPRFYHGLSVLCGIILKKKQYSLPQQEPSCHYPENNLWNYSFEYLQWRVCQSFAIACPASSVQCHLLHWTLRSMGQCARIVRVTILCIEISLKF